MSRVAKNVCYFGTKVRETGKEEKKQEKEYKVKLTRDKERERKKEKVCNVKVGFW